jgi:hypothetical protein
MSRRKLGEKQIWKKGLDIEFRISHTFVHDASSTGPAAAAKPYAAAEALSSVARTSLR